VLTVDFDLLPIKSGERVLDLGCGSGRHSWHVCKLDTCTLCAMDYDITELQKNRYMLGLMDSKKETKGRWCVMQGNAMYLPFKDSCFDKIICSEVMEHVIDDEQATRELFRVLKEDGLLAVSVPARKMESLYWKISEAYHTNPGGHIRIYRLRQLIDMLKRNDLEVYEVRYKHAFHSVYWLLRCLFGVRNEKARIPALYHSFLAWEMEAKSRFFRRLEKALDHVFPKSVVVYVRKGLR
jgi:ubiquinone/menaquinone biosynthesis C-methylase UbiE